MRGRAQAGIGQRPPRAQPQTSTNAGDLSGSPPRGGLSVCASMSRFAPAENYLQMAQTRAASDPFINHETVRRCTRFVPGSRPRPLPRQKKALQASLKPTPGLEPGTPSLRVKRVQLAD